MEILEIEIQIIDGTNQVVIVCAETGRMIGRQTNSVIESQNEGFTVATVTFDVPPKKVKK